MPQGASVPALGLSNKAVFDDSENQKENEKGPNLAEDFYKEIYFNVIDLDSKDFYLTFFIQTHKI